MPGIKRCDAPDTGNITTKTIPMTQYRHQLNSLWPDVAAGKIRYVVTFRGRPAFVMRPTAAGGLRNPRIAR